VKLPYCAKCGAELKEDAKFCPYCGTPTPLATPEEIRKAKREMRKIEWWE